MPSHASKQVHARPDMLASRDFFLPLYLRPWGLVLLPQAASRCKPLPCMAIDRWQGNGPARQEQVRPRLRPAQAGFGGAWRPSSMAPTAACLASPRSSQLANRRVCERAPSLAGASVKGRLGSSRYRLLEWWPALGCCEPVDGTEARCGLRVGERRRGRFRAQALFGLRLIRPAGGGSDGAAGGGGGGGNWGGARLNLIEITMAMLVFLPCGPTPRCKTVELQRRWEAQAKRLTAGNCCGRVDDRLARREDGLRQAALRCGGWMWKLKALNSGSGCAADRPVEGGKQLQSGLEL